MASVRARQRLDGTMAWQVLWRHNNRQTSATYETEKDALRAADYLTHTGRLPPEDDHRIPGERNVSDLLDHHISQLTGVEQRTRNDYKRAAERHIKPHLGNVLVRDLTRTDVARWVNAHPGRPKTVRNHHALLSAAYKTGMRDKWCDDNPAAGMKLARTDDHDIVTMTADEVGAIIAAMPEHWRPLVMFLAGTGCRWGEAVAVKVADIDLHAGTVRLSKAVKRVERGTATYIGTTKTKRGKRTVSLPAQLLVALAPLVRDRRKTALLFTTPTGAPVDHPHFYERQWKPAVTALGLDPRPRIHDLRHYHISHLVAQGVPVNIIQLRVGHEKVTTTLDTYGHLFPDALGIAAAAAARTLPAAALEP